MADGYIVVKCHHAQEHKLCSCHGEGKEHLHAQVEKEMVFLGGQEAVKDEGDGGGCVADVQEGEVPQEEVYGRVQAGVKGGHQDEEPVAQQDHQVREQDEHKELSPALGGLRGPGEWTLPGGGLIGPVHSASAPSPAGTQKLNLSTLTEVLAC